MVFNDVRCVVNKQVFIFFGGGHRPLIYCFINIKIIFIFIKYENAIYNYKICVSIKVTKLMAISLSVVDWKYATHQSHPSPHNLTEISFVVQSNSYVSKVRIENQRVFWLYWLLKMQLWTYLILNEKLYSNRRIHERLEIQMSLPTLYSYYSLDGDISTISVSNLPHFYKIIIKYSHYF